MATKVLINASRLGTVLVWPGSAFDSVNDAADIALIESAGGVFFDASDPTIAAAAEKARAVRLQAGEVSLAESIMQSAVQEVQENSIGTIPTTMSSVAQNVNSATTGLTVDSATTGATVNSVSLGWHETFVKVEANATSYGTIAESAASANPTAQPSHPRVLDVVFAAGWEGGDVTVSGLDPLGNAVQEIFVSPGGGGGTVNGTKVFATITTPGGITNSVTGGAADVATVQSAAGIGVTNKPAVAFVKLSVDGVHEAVASSNLGEGWFVPTTAPTGLLDYEVWYTAGHSHGVTDAGHSHSVTDAGHAHTGIAHSHTLS